MVKNRYKFKIISLILCFITINSTCVFSQLTPICNEYDTTYTGTCIEYYPKLGQYEVKNYLNGQLHGVQIRYNTNNDTKHYQDEYIYGVRNGNAISYYSNGNIKESRGYKNGILDGLFVRYYENGQIKSSYTYKSEKQDGPCLYFYENGNKEMELNFSNGIQNGWVNEYFENGQLKEKAFYINGKVDGTSYGYYENGQLRVVFTYKKGVYDGLVLYYDITGKLIGRKYYINDELVKQRRLKCRFDRPFRIEKSLPKNG